MKRTLSIILSVFMAFSALPFVAFAEGGECTHENYEWVYHGNGETNYDCTSKPAYRDKVCSDCGEIILKNSQIALQSKHTFALDSEKSVKPTCSSEGVNVYDCIYCTVTTTEQVPALMHKWGEYAVSRLCFEDGTNTQGEYIRFCKLCGAADTKGIIDHTYFVAEGKPASCFSAGSTDAKYCNICGTYSKSEEIPQLEHIDENGDTKCDLCNSPTVDNGAFCGCLCHSESSFVQLILPILTFIWKLLGVDSCNCGKSHY